MEGPEDFGFYGGAEMSVTAKKQSIVDAFYKHHGPCCAGCDWWRWHNTSVGECTRTVPVSGADRYSMLGINWSSLIPGAGHIMTKRDHVCGEFIDTGSKA